MWFRCDVQVQLPGRLRLEGLGADETSHGWRDRCALLQTEAACSAGPAGGVSRRDQNNKGKGIKKKRESRLGGTYVHTYMLL